MHNEQQFLNDKEIPDLNSRVISWEKFVTNLDPVERENVLLSSEETDDSVKDRYDYIKETICSYTNDLEKLIERLRRPLVVLMREYVQELKNDALRSIDLKVEIDYKHALSLNLKDNGKKYLSDKLTMITPFMFQSPLLTSPERWEREIMQDACKAWNATQLSELYKSKLKEQFSDYAADSGN